MEKMPQVVLLEDGSKLWENRFEKFEAKVYQLKCDPITDAVNYGFMTPYLLVFEENKYTPKEAKKFADESGLTEIYVCNL